MTLEGLQTILDAVELMSNQFISPISTLPDGTFTANIITLVDDNGNGIPNYLDVTETQIRSEQLQYDSYQIHKKRVALATLFLCSY